MKYGIREFLPEEKAEAGEKEVYITHDDGSTEGICTVINPHECENCGMIYDKEEHGFSDDQTRSNGGILHSCPKCQRITKEI